MLLRIFLPSRPPIVSFRDSSGRQAAIRRNHGPGRGGGGGGRQENFQGVAPAPLLPPLHSDASFPTSRMERSPSSSSIVTGTTTNPTTEGREKEWQAGIEASRAPSASTFFPCTHSRTGETASEASGRTEGWLAVLSPFLARKRSRHSIRTAGDQKRWWRKQRKTSSRKLFSGQKKEESSLHSSSEPTPAQVVGKEEDLPSLSLQRLHQCTTHSISKAAVDEIGARLPRIERRRRKISGFSCCSSGAPVFVRETPSFLGS